jgi:hypothetical protein
VQFSLSYGVVMRIAGKDRDDSGQVTSAHEIGSGFG